MMCQCVTKNSSDIYRLLSLEKHTQILYFTVHVNYNFFFRNTVQNYFSNISKTTRMLPQMAHHRVRPKLCFFSVVTSSLDQQQPFHCSFKTGHGGRGVRKICVGTIGLSFSKNEFIPRNIEQMDMLIHSIGITSALGQKSLRIPFR
jgi:hypothetical protein